VQFQPSGAVFTRLHAMSGAERSCTKARYMHAQRADSFVASENACLNSKRDPTYLREFSSGPVQKCCRCAAEHAFTTNNLQIQCKISLMVAVAVDDKIPKI
jgi:hypothetical protein